MKPMPVGTNVSTAASTAAPSDVQFLHDLTRAQTTTGELVHEQRIFDEIFRIIDESDRSSSPTSSCSLT